MFDNIGQDPDLEASKRSLLSTLITTAVCSATTGALLWITAPIAKEALLPPPDDFPVEVVMVPEDDTPTIPSPPASGGGTPEPTTTEPEPPEPEPEPEPNTLSPVDDAPLERTTPQGGSKGNGTGTGGGTGDCVGEGCAEHGVPGGDSSAQRIHPNLEVKRRLELRYPKGAEALGLGTQRCRARVFIDERGAPYDVRVEDCPAAFHAETRAGLLRWRWYPPRSGGERVKAQTIVSVTYELR